MVSDSLEYRYEFIEFSVFVWCAHNPLLVSHGQPKKYLIDYNALLWVVCVCVYVCMFWVFKNI